MLKPYAWCRIVPVMKYFVLTRAHLGTSGTHSGTIMMT